jgi:hypothetical protein
MVPTGSGFCYATVLLNGRVPTNAKFIYCLIITDCYKANCTGQRKTYLGLLQKFTYLLRGLSPQVNYTDRAAAACRRS